MRTHHLQDLQVTKEKKCKYFTTLPVNKNNNINIKKDEEKKKNYSYT